MHLNFVPQVSCMISLGEREMISQRMEMIRIGANSFVGLVMPRLIGPRIAH